MSQRVSMTDIARRLDVSRATVSYVLNDPDTALVGPAMRERVLEAAREMGYRPNRAAQVLKGRPSHIIQLCVHGYYPAFYARALYEFEEQIAPTPYELYIVHPHRWPDNDYLKADTGWPADGVIVCDAYLYPNAIDFLKEHRIPVVTLGLASIPDIDHIRIDLNPALLEAMRHLTARRGRVVYISPWEMDITTADADPRYHAYHSVMKEAGLAEEVIVCPDVKGPQTRAVAREIVRDYVAANGCPQAIFCFNDERAIATLDALRDLNYRVPQDVLLIGCDGIDETAYHSPKLSTIHYPIEEGARLAWQCLQRRIEQPDIPLQSTTLTAPLLLRESSAL